MKRASMPISATSDAELARHVREERRNAGGDQGPPGAEDDAVAQDHITVDEIDDFLDEIDSVLEENAQDFVRAYVQRGGQ